MNDIYESKCEDLKRRSLEIKKKFENGFITREDAEKEIIEIFEAFGAMAIEMRKHLLRPLEST